MATVKHARGVKLLLKVGNGGTPEVFAAYCSINAARGITFSSTTNEFQEIDCDNPDQVAWMVREKTALSVAVSGAGMLNTPDLEAFFDWWKDETAKNCQIVVDVPDADGGLIFEGAFHLTEFGVTGDRGSKMEVSLSLASDGEVTAAANV